MCLVVRRAKYEEPFKPSVAKKDIVCYKVMKNPDRDGTYTTPYKHTIVANRVIEGRELMCATGIREVDWFYTNNKFVYKIGCGFIHTFQTLRESRRVLSRLPFHPCEYNIFKCVIPKGVNYFKGEDMNCFVSYASDSIRFIKKID